MTNTPNRRRQRLATLSVGLMVAHQLTPSMCFGTTSLPQRTSTSSTQRFFRDTSRVATDDVLLEDAFAQSFPSTMLYPPPSQSRDLPAWLSVPQGHLCEENLFQLQKAMTESFFTESETGKLLFAIQSASGGDQNKMAGAAEFSLILVETMEMGLNALVAAVFHYCSCVTLRERSLDLPPGSMYSASLWDHQDYTGIEAFGAHAELIANDAARLKKLEMVASLIMRAPDKAMRVSPDSVDADNLRQLLLAEATDWRALAIRSGACLYRLRGLLKSGQAQYLTPEAVSVSREALHIYAPLASRLGMHRLKNELEGAAFRILYRRQFAKVKLLEQIDWSDMHYDAGLDIGQAMQHVLTLVQEEMKEMLENSPDFTEYVEEFTVTARVKEPYSMWKKMLRNRSSHILDVPDAVALRIVLKGKKLSPDEDDEVTRARERALCYFAQKLCIERWRPLEHNPRFKDYIENPKPNGYQSLHYTASTSYGTKDWTMEIQVRSAEMHKVAEFGLASHWDYKASKKIDDQPVPLSELMLSDDHATDAYLRSVQQWHWEQHGSSRWDASPTTTEPLENDSQLRADRMRARTEHMTPYIQALVSAQSDLARKHVFVFITQSPDLVSTEGQVIALPAGACVLDALREAERSSGLPLPWSDEAMSMVSHNGGVAYLTTQLHNGDILSIPAATVTFTA